jgi:hypothetical protein
MCFEPPAFETPAGAAPAAMSSYRFAIRAARHSGSDAAVKIGLSRNFPFIIIGMFFLSP